MVVYCNRQLANKLTHKANLEIALFWACRPGSVWFPPICFFFTFRVLLSGKRVHLAPTWSRHIALPPEPKLKLNS